MMSAAKIRAHEWSFHRPYNSLGSQSSEGQKYKRICGPLNFTIDQEEKVLILGPSGSGKSTLLHTIAGIDQEDSIAEGNLNNDFSVSGLVRQNPNDNLVEKELDLNIAFGAENLAHSPQIMHDKLTQVCVELGVDSFANTQQLNRDPETLSGGQKQIVALAMSLMMDPELLLFDEPCAHLDQSTTRVFLDSVLDIVTQKEKTLIVVDHDQKLWLDHVGRVLVLTSQGMLEFDGDPTTYRQQYLEVSGDEVGSETFFKGVSGGFKDSEIKSLGRSGQKKLACLSAEQLSVSPASETSKKRRRFPYARQRKKLHKGGFPLVQEGIDWTITSGGLWIVQGENGSGKTTTALTIAGLIDRAGGKLTSSFAESSQIECLDPNIASSKKLSARVSMAFQDPREQFMYDTVREEIQYNSDGSFLDVVQAFDLEENLDQNPYTLSGGQQRRLSLACVVAQGSDVMIFDEPTAGQDLLHAHKIGRVLISLTQLGHGIVVISHDQRFMDQLSKAGAQTRVFSSNENYESVQHGVSNEGQAAKVENFQVSRSKENLKGGSKSLNPLTICAAMVCFSLTAIVSKNFVTLSFLLVAEVIFLCVLKGSAVGSKKFVRILLSFLGLTVFSSWYGVVLLGNDSGQTLANVMGYTISEGSMNDANIFALRTSCIAVAGLYSILNINTYDLASMAAQRLKISDRFVVSVLLASQVAGSVSRMWASLSRGQRTRGKNKEMRKIGHFFAHVVMRADSLSVTAEACGFRIPRSYRRTWFRTPVVGPADTVAIIFVCVVCLGSIISAVLLGQWEAIF